MRQQEKRQQENREHRRLQIRLPLEYVVRDEEDACNYRTITHNISTHGVYFEIEGRRLREGQQIDLRLTVPPGTHFPYHGHVSTVAEVIRVEALNEADASDASSGEDNPVQEVGQESDRRARYGIGAKLDRWTLLF